jgi:hypothetical protein
MDMLQSNHLFKMKDTTLDFIKKITGQSGNSFTTRVSKFNVFLLNLSKLEQSILKLNNYKNIFLLFC